MQKVEGSNPFIRSIQSQRGDVAEWLGTGLQNPLHRFNSGRRLLISPQMIHLMFRYLLRGDSRPRLCVLCVP